MKTIIIPDERPISWNTYYSGGHWNERNKEAKRVHMLVRTYCLATGHQAGDTFKRPVSIIVNAFFKSRPQDADNIAAKLYIDGLKGFLIDDDTPAHVAMVTTASYIDKADPRVEIMVEEIAQ